MKRFLSLCVCVFMCAISISKAATPPTDAELCALADRVWTPKTEAEEQQTYTDIQALPADAFRPLLVYLYKSKYYFDGEGKPYMVGPVRSFFAKKLVT